MKIQNQDWLFSVIFGEKGQTLLQSTLIRANEMMWFK